MNKMQANLITARRNARMLYEDYNWPENLRRLNCFELNKLFSKDKAFLDRVKASLLSFLNYGVPQEIVTVNPCAFLTVYKARYHADNLFCVLRDPELKDFLIRRAAELSEHFEIMISEFRQDRSCDLHSQPMMSFGEQISILSKPVIGKYFVQSIISFNIKLNEYVELIEQIALKLYVKKQNAGQAAKA